MGILMTLSKAIFTGRKRSNFLLLLIFFFLIPSLSAASYRVGIVTDSDAPVPYVENFPRLIEFAAREIVNEDLLSQAVKRDEENAQMDWEKEVSDLIRREADVSTLSPQSVDTSSYEVEIVPLSPSDEDVAFIASSDEAALAYTKLLYDLDELYYISVREEDGLYSVEIYLEGQRIFHFLFSEYVESDAQQEILSYLLLRYRGGLYALARLNGNTMASVSVDGNAAEQYGEYMVLPFGLRHLEITSPSFIPLTLDVMVDENIEIIEYELEKVRSVPLFISTIPYTDEIYYQGEKVMNGYVSETTYPFSLIVNKDGYETRTIQSDEGEHSVVAALLPSSLYDPARLEDKKGEFYTHLLVTLLTYGASVAVDVVSDIYSLNLTPVSTIARGVSVVELIRTVTALFEYRDALGYGI